jgi:hypothetical protein
MTALKLVSGELVDNDQISKAKELDQKIRECVRDYVQLGKLLMDMRDGQSYRLLGPYSTFEEYVKDIEGLAITVAQLKIKAYLVHKAIEENLGPQIHGPRTEYQVAQLFRHETAIAKFRTEKRIVEKADGTKTPIEVPVAVSNPKRVAEQWASIVKSHEAAVERAKVAYEKKVQDATETGRPLPPFLKPPLSGKFVVNSLPTEHQPVAKVKSDAHVFTRLVGDIAKKAEELDGYLGQENEVKWQRAVALPDRKRLSKGVRDLIAQDIDEAIEILTMFKKDLAGEFSN